MKRYELAMVAGLLLALILTPLADFWQRCDQSRNQVLRLHILANSDNDADQRLKYQVRDAVLEATGATFAGDKNLSELTDAAREALPLIEETANRTLAAQGSTQRATARLAKLYFGTRSYNGVIFPAGRYEAVQVLLGEGEGKNWWCVMYPPMCLPAAAPKEDVKLDIEELDGKPRYKMAFATVELVEHLRERMEKPEQPAQ